MTKRERTFREILSDHMENLSDTRYKAIDCLIHNYILRSGCKLRDIELVQTTVENEVTWSIRKKHEK